MLGVSALAQQTIDIALINRQVTVKFDGVRKYVEIKWQSRIERGFSYYTLQRSLPDSTSMTDSKSWIDLAIIDTVSTADTIKSYGYLDYPVKVASYIYRVKLVTSDNNVTAHLGIGSVPAALLADVSALTPPEIPQRYDCIKNYPNPFNPATTIVLDLPAAEQGSLVIVDMLGRQIECLLEGSLHRGVHRYQWNALNYPSGIYFCILRTSTKTVCAKLVLQK
jgi:hypothetical protein